MSPLSAQKQPEPEEEPEPEPQTEKKRKKAGAAFFDRMAEGAAKKGAKKWTNFFCETLTAAKRFGSPFLIFFCPIDLFFTSFPPFVHIFLILKYMVLQLEQTWVSLVCFIQFIKVIP